MNSNFASKDFHEVRAIWQGGQKEEVCLYVIKDYEGHPTLEAGFAASETDEADGWCCLPLLKGIGETEGYQSGQALSLSELQSLCASDLTRVAAFLRSDACKSVYVLTGAGVSTGAGIPDFRSAGGLYDSIRPELITASFIQRQKMRFDPTYVVERDMFFQNPFPYLEVRRPFILGTHRQQWKATISHWFMKFLEEEGKLKRLFTQNIDGLDYQTGISPTRVTNVHGSIARVSCEGCGKEMPFDDFCAQVRTNIKDIYKTDPEAPEESTSIPCPHCQHPLVKPNTILFGSNLPEEFFDRVPELHQADLLLVAGTSLVVSPANSAVNEVPGSCMRVIINREQVGQDLGVEYGPHAMRDVWSGERTCDETFLQLIKLMGWQERLRRVKHRLPESNQDMLQDL